MVLVGNPNVGKTLIFNQLTKLHQKIANFPGVTITKKIGTYYANNRSIEIIDLPGLYGFSSSKIEEQQALFYLFEEDYDLIINVIDTTKLERNLLLTLQLLELGKNMMVVSNFYDKIKELKLQIDYSKLQDLLNIPIIKLSAIKTSDFDLLLSTIDHAIIHPIKTKPMPLEEFDPLLKKASMHLVENREALPNGKFPSRLYKLITLFELKSLSDRYLKDKIKLNIPIDELKYQLFGEEESVYLNYITNQYDVIEKLYSDTVFQSNSTSKTSISDRIDRVLLHPILGFAVFISVMALVFVFTFLISIPISNLITNLELILANTITNHLSNKLLISFLVDGVIGGIGFVLIFLPQIAILFLFLAILDHSGYLTRVVFITDRFLNKIGISGNSIAPMLLGFGCNVPAIISTNAIKNQNERKVIALANPFIPCSARFPVFVVFASAMFGKYAGVVILALYFIGIILAILTIIVLRSLVFKGETEELIMELPNLSIPSFKIVSGQIYLQTKRFIQNAATYMGVGVLVVWLLSITGPSVYLGPEALSDGELIQKSWVFMLGRIISPVFAPFGWDERLVTTLIFGFIAKEIIIGSMGIIFGVGANLGSLNAIIAAQFTPFSAFAFMLFVLTYTPCIATYFVLKQEIGKKWANFSVIFGIVIGWILAFLTTLIGGLF